MPTPLSTVLELHTICNYTYVLMVTLKVRRACKEKKKKKKILKVMTHVVLT